MPVGASRCYLLDRLSARHPHERYQDGPHQRSAGIYPTLRRAAATEAKAMKGERVLVVGGGNSAGQAAVHLARYAAQVTLLVRGSSLARTMSDYLVQELQATPNIAVRYHTEAVAGHGDGHLTALTLQDHSSGAAETVPAAALFVLIGAEPHTGWLPPAIRRDRWGFVVTDTDLLGGDGRPPAEWPLERPPLPSETSLPGGVRGRRRPPRVDQAGRLRGRRGLGRHPGDPPVPELGIATATPAPAFQGDRSHAHLSDALPPYR
jgi:Pyridine nucleotide-disulphide oxidoreductase